jgi:hypothetical protein
MSKKDKGNEPAKEESLRAEFWTHLPFAPSKYITALNHIAMRVNRAIEKASKDSEKNYHKKTMQLVEQLALKMNEDFAPKPPKVIDDAYNYALSRSYEGTFLALLDSEGNLVKTVIVAKKRLSDLPEFSITEEVVPMEMKAKFINIPEFDIKRNIPKKVASVVPFSSDKKQVYAYKEK